MVILPSLRPLPRLLSPSIRLYSTAPTPPKVPIALISSLRTLRPGTALSLARTALQSSSPPLDLPAALKWIEQQAIDNGEKRKEKLAGREAKEGLVGVVVIGDGFGAGKAGKGGVRMAMVEVNCETDFVGRTEEFRETVLGWTNSLAWMAEDISTSPSSSSPSFSSHTFEELKDLPLLPSPTSSSPSSSETATSPSSDTTLATLSTSLSSLISRLGENITLRRASVLSIPPPKKGDVSSFYLSSFLHGSTKTPLGAEGEGGIFESGRIGGVLLFELKGSKGISSEENLKKLTRAFARQTVALPTSSVSAATSSTTEGEPSTSLYDQTLITLSPSSIPELGMKGGDSLTVKEVVQLWKEGELEVRDLRRWEVGGE